MPNLLFCCLCGRKIPEWKYVTARFCSDYCRKAFYDVKVGRCKDIIISQLRNGSKLAEGVGSSGEVID